jgi:ABC-type sugar transport system substrate-binding protein
MKRVATLALGLLFVLCAAGLVFAGGTGEKAGGASGKITIAYTGFPGGQTPFWAQMTEYVKQEAAAEGVDLIDLSPTEADAAQQKASVDNAINRGVQGIIIGSIDNRAFGESLRRAQAKHIVVVAVDTAIDDPAVTALAQTDNLASARVMGQYIVDHVPTKGKVLILGGTLGHQTGDLPRGGLE